MEEKDKEIESEILEEKQEIQQTKVTVLERKPTFRQERLAERLIENGGNVSKSMREVGYSENYAINPHKVTTNKTFLQLLERKLPEKHLLKKHREFLDSKKIIRVYIKGELKETTEETDSNAVKALDMAYKLKGKYQDKVGNNVLVINVSKQSSDRYKSTPAVILGTEAENDVVANTPHSEIVGTDATTDTTILGT